MADFEFEIGEDVGCANDATYGPVIERVRHEFAGGVRIKYYYHARTKLPSGHVLPPMILEAFEHELKRRNDWQDWHLPAVKYTTEAP
jgi:hypothetical protein